MKVYVITNSWQYDTGESGIETKVFFHENLARDYFKQAQEDAKNDFAEGAKNVLDCDVTVDEDENSFSIYESGEYCYNHIDIKFQEQEVSDWMPNQMFFEEQIRSVLEVEKADNEKLFKKLNKNIESIIKDIVVSLNDDERVFEEMDSSIRYYFWHHEKVQKLNK